MEVFAAVHGILNRFGSDTQIVLVGHSRGRLAARTFLQGSNSPERRSVVGLVTVGTPHDGTPLGRVYGYLKKYCLNANGRYTTGPLQDWVRWSACAADWEAVDLLKSGVGSSGMFAQDLYLGRPTIDALRPESLDLTRLNIASAVARLPSAAAIVQLRSKGRYLGDLHQYYNAWSDINPMSFSKRSRNYALCGNVSDCPLKEDNRAFVGDGVVPVAAQSIPGLSAPALIMDMTAHPNPRHGDETGGIGDLDKALLQIPAWP